jgi:hypothetical protein
MWLVSSLKSADARRSMRVMLPLPCLMYRATFLGMWSDEASYRKFMVPDGIHDQIFDSHSQKGTYASSVVKLYTAQTVARSKSAVLAVVARATNLHVSYEPTLVDCILPKQCDVSLTLPLSELAGAQAGSHSTTRVTMWSSSRCDCGGGDVDFESGNERTICLESRWMVASATST